MHDIMTNTFKLTPAPEKDRYFAIVIRVPAGAAKKSLGGIQDASTVMGDCFKAVTPAFLPEGSRITRSIEISEEFATRSW